MKAIFLFCGDGGARGAIQRMLRYYSSTAVAAAVSRACAQPVLGRNYCTKSVLMSLVYSPKSVMTKGFGGQVTARLQAQVSLPQSPRQMVI